MLKFKRSVKANANSYNDKSEDFIPIACHYNENTLLTKNGELIQIIQINGVNSELVSNKLLNLREIVRRAIEKDSHSRDFAFWIHTVRRKTNLDDLTPYDRLLSANIHKMWRKKNYWDDKFVNTLYISVVSDSLKTRINNPNSFKNSLIPGKVFAEHEQYFDNALQTLETEVNHILEELLEYGAVKLGLKFEDEKCFSDPMFLYRRIINLSEDECILPVNDLSAFLSTQRYAIGNDKMEVITDYGKKFASIISIKEFHEISANSLDAFMQLPVELIATEVFYNIDKKDALPAFDEQEYILKVSGDKNLRDIKGLSAIFDSEHQDQKESEEQFCLQQISITVISDNIKPLDDDVKSISAELSKIGVVHVKEDILLEQTLWAQLPGNFSFLRRMTPNVMANTAALASLHNFPTGSKFSKWGKAITLLRTDKGTPYFMHLHNDNNEIANCVIGVRGSGKTVMTNFFISEATKLNPTILYFSDNNDSKIFIEGIEGQWLENVQNIVNPFVCEDTPTNRQFIKEFLKILCNHYVNSLSEAESAMLDLLIEKIFALPILERNLRAAEKVVDFSAEGGEALKTKLANYFTDGIYKDIFSSQDTAFEFNEKSVTGFNLSKVTDNNIRAAIIYATAHQLAASGNSCKILALDNVSELLDINYYSQIIKGISELIMQNNGIIISNINLAVTEHQVTDVSFYQKWLKLFSTRFILAPDQNIKGLEDALGLTEAESDKLLSFIGQPRLFMIKDSNKSIAVELSIGSLSAIVRILSGRESELKIYADILKENPGHPDNWLEHLYEALEEE